MVSEHQFFESVYLVAVLLLVAAAALPLARSGRQVVRQAAVWVLIGGFLVALFLVGEWILQ